MRYISRSTFILGMAFALGVFLSSEKAVYSETLCDGFSGTETSSSTETTEYYVSSDGNDENDGKTSEKAWASLAKARDVIREERRNGNSNSCKVYIRGTISVTEPFTLDERDSDTSYVGIGTDATISGGVSLTGWRVLSDEEKNSFPNPSGEIWSADLPDYNYSVLYFEEMFVNGKRAVRSRFPNEGFLRAQNCWEETAFDDGQVESTTAKMQKLSAFEKDVQALNLQALSSKELNSAQLVVHHKWDTTRRIILGYEPEKQVFVTRGAPCHQWNAWNNTSLYYLENLKGAFDNAGEWLYDKEVKKVFYRPLPNESIDSAQIIVPVPGLNQLLIIAGSADKKVANVIFDNISFEYTDAARRPEIIKASGIDMTITGDPEKPGPSQFNQNQAAAFAIGTIQVTDSEGIELKNCNISHVGEYGLSFKDTSDSLVEYCSFTDLGAGAVKIGGGKLDSHNTVENCTMSEGGRFFASATAVWIGQNTENIALLHCDISDFYYTGVSVGWVWGYQGGHAFNNRIEFNRISKIGQGQLSDMGGVYTLGTSTGTRVCNNVIFDVSSYGYGGWGLYPDEGSEGILFENNLVYDTTDGSFHQHYGKENIVRNNIFARSRINPARMGQPPHQIAVTRIENHLSMTFENNIIYWKEGIPLGYNAGKEQAVYRNNLWFNACGEVRFGELTHDEWVNQTGKDVGGLVADPEFINPDANDFRLKSDSPATHMGFVPFDYSQAGVIKK